MSARVTIVDYGLGNLHSVEKSLQHLGCTVDVAGSAEGVDRGEKLILPGVGAYAEGMAGLRQRGQDHALRRYAASGRPLLGICLGAQLLLDESEEFGRHDGLGLIPGRVVRIRAGGAKVPHVGWARLSPAGGSAPFSSVLRPVPAGAWAYFIHSYHMVPADPAALVATCVCGTEPITAALARGAVAGVQFHPEKSGTHGLEILREFCRS